MALLSKPSKLPQKLVIAYLTHLYSNPIRTKSITAGVIATLGNYVAQVVGGAPKTNLHTLSAFGLFGLLFGGTVPHFFYQILSRIIDESSKTAGLRMLLIERFFFMPAYTFFSLYTLSRFECNPHKTAMSNTLRVYPSVIEANFKYLTILQFLNMTFVPPVLRVLVNTLIGFFWIIFLAKMRNIKAKKGKDTKTQKN